METKKQTEEKKESKKQQAISVSYTLKSLSNNIEKLIKTKMITEEEGVILKEIKDKAVSRYIKDKF